MNNLFQNQYRISSARMDWHEYGDGSYFVTICTAGMEHRFGEIIAGKMIMNVLGRYVDDTIQNVATHYPYAEIPLYVVMPNHIHLIVYIDGDKTPYQRRSTDAVSRDAACHVCTDADSTDAAHHTASTDAACHVSTKDMCAIANQQGWLSVVIGGIKSAITRYANANNITFGWQTRFHEHIIRNQDEMNKIANYVQNNVAQWDADKFNAQPHSRDVACCVSTSAGDPSPAGNPAGDPHSTDVACRVSTSAGDPSPAGDPADGACTVSTIKNKRS